MGKDQLWQSGVGFGTYRDRQLPMAQVATYPFPRGFAVAGGSVDVQGGNSSLCFLPGMETAEKECWYINMGAVDRDFFSTEAMVRAAQ